MKYPTETARETFTINRRGAPEIVVYDNTPDGLSAAQACEVARRACDALEFVFWSDDRLCNWCFDFPAAGHWCSGLFHNNGCPDELDDFGPFRVSVGPLRRA